MRIFIYNDYIHNNYEVEKFFIEKFPNAEVKQCDSRDIINGRLDQSVDCFVFPGGADLFHVEKLNGAGNAAIKNYVKNGGRYIGICGGAYFASAALEFAKNWPNVDEISGTRELNLIDTIATGPIQDYCDMGQAMPAAYDSVCQLEYSPPNGDSRKITGHYSGGPYFHFNKADSIDCEIIARYADITESPAAIIHKQLQQGQVLLIGPHLEYPPHRLMDMSYAHNNSLARRQKIAEAITPHEDGRNELWAILFEKLGLKS